MRSSGILWRRVFLALFVLIALVGVSLYLTRHTLYAWRAAWLRQSASEAMAEAKMEEAINQARSAWLVSPGNADSARLLLGLLAPEKPQEAMQWLLWLEQKEALQPDDLVTGATLAFRLNQPAMALFWRNQMGDTDAPQAMIDEHDAIMAGLWGSASAWLDWVATDIGEHLDRCAERRCLTQLTRRLTTDQQAHLVSFLEGEVAVVERPTLLTISQVLAGHPAFNEQLWPRLWALVRDDNRLSGNERLRCLLAAAQSEPSSSEVLRAALDELELFPSESAGLLAILRFQLGDFKEAVDLADDPLTSLGEPWRTQVRLQARFMVGPAKQFFETVKTVPELRSSFRLAWEARGRLRYDDDRVEADELLDQALQAAKGEERLELAQLLYQWSETERARGVLTDLLEHPGLSQRAVAGLVRDAFQSGDEDLLKRALNHAQFGAKEVGPVGIQLCFGAWLTAIQMETARDWLIQALLTSPQDENARVLLAAIQLKLGNSSLARMHAAHSVSPEVPDPRAALLKAWTRRQLDPSAAQGFNLEPGTPYPPAFPSERAILIELGTGAEG